MLSKHPHKLLGNYNNGNLWNDFSTTSSGICNYPKRMIGPNELYMPIDHKTIELTLSCLGRAFQWSWNYHITLDVEGIWAHNHQHLFWSTLAYRLHIEVNFVEKVWEQKYHYSQQNLRRSNGDNVEDIKLGQLVIILCFFYNLDDGMDGDPWLKYTNMYKLWKHTCENVSFQIRSLT